MTYQEIETTNIDGTTQKHIIVELGDGAFKSFPADPENPEYVAFLASLEEATDSEPLTDSN
jgi:hypothetical protein